MPFLMRKPKRVPQKVLEEFMSGKKEVKTKIPLSGREITWHVSEGEIEARYTSWRRGVLQRRLLATFDSQGKRKER